MSDGLCDLCEQPFKSCRGAHFKGKRKNLCPDCLKQFRINEKHHHVELIDTYEETKEERIERLVMTKVHNEWYPISETEDTIKKVIAETIRLRDADKIETVHTVTTCKDSIFHGFGCLENDTHYGFFKDETDIRPSSCTWIEKYKAEKVYSILKE